ncbi:MAG: hypothetical protein ACR2RB_09810, partial [Gammaproteobacteria bacterium]
MSIDAVRKLAWLFCLALVPANVTLAQEATQETADWNGQWDTQWRGGGARLDLLQNGDQVIGSYQPYDGLIDARATGRLLIGRWIEKQNSGDFVFTMAPDGQTFMGRFASGEWWNGGRVSGAKDTSVFLSPDLSTPRAALRSFLVAFNQLRAGHTDFTVPAIAAVDFGSGAEEMVDGLRIANATALFDVIDQCTLQIWSVPTGADGDSLEVELTQAGTDEAFLLEFKRSPEGHWRLAAQPVEVLEATLDAFLAARGEKRRRPNTHLELRSPRATLRTFVENVHQAEPSAQEHVLRTMDLSNIDESVQATEALLLADYLRQVLNRISFLIWQEIPDDATSPLPYIYFEHPAGNIVIAPQRDGAETVWKFTSGTLETLRDLFNAIEAMPVVEGVAAPKERLLFFRVRDVMTALSPSLTTRTFLLENWQWLGMLLAFVVSVIVAFGLTMLVV